MSTDCFFCTKLSRLNELPAEDIVGQFTHSLALLGPWQYYHGYCILIARRHATELSQLNLDERYGFFDETCKLAWAIEVCFKPRKLNYELLGNQVPHLHWHLFPRRSDDPEMLKPVWLALDRAEQDENARRRLQNGPIPRSETAAMLRRCLAEIP